MKKRRFEDGDKFLKWFYWFGFILIFLGLGAGSLKCLEIIFMAGEVFWGVVGLLATIFGVFFAYCLLMILVSFFADVKIIRNKIHEIDNSNLDFVYESEEKEEEKDA